MQRAITTLVGILRDRADRIGGRLSLNLSTDGNTAICHWTRSPVYPNHEHCAPAALGTVSDLDGLLRELDAYVAKQRPPISAAAE